jgi:hypothetical protein
LFHKAKEGHTISYQLTCLEYVALILNSRHDKYC